MLRLVPIANYAFDYLRGDIESPKSTDLTSILGAARLACE